MTPIYVLYTTGLEIILLTVTVHSMLSGQLTLWATVSLFVVFASHFLYFLKITNFVAEIMLICIHHQIQQAWVREFLLIITGMYIQSYRRPRYDVFPLLCISFLHIQGICAERLALILMIYLTTLCIRQLIYVLAVLLTILPRHLHVEN